MACRVTTTDDLIARTRRHAYTETADERNRLSAGVTDTDTVLTFDFDMGGIIAGATISIGLEEMMVWTVTATSAEVARGQGGSTAAVHAAGDLVRVKPKMSPFAILQALNEDLLDLSAQGLYRVRTVEVTYDGNTAAYNLTGVTDITDIIDVTFDAIDGTSRWVSIPRAGWRLKRGLPTADFASGLAFTLNSYAMPGQPINITYKAPFSPLTALTDDVAAVTGLPVTAVDIPPMGAVIRLTAGGEVARNFLNQGETRRAGEVPAGARLGSMRGLMMLRQQRIEAEASRLYAKYPVVRS